MIKIAILGFGNLGQTLLKRVQEEPKFQQRFEVVALWNRTTEVFDQFEIPKEIKVYASLPSLIQNLKKVDLVVECSHSSIVKKYALDILADTDLFVSSPTAFADMAFYQSYIHKMEKNEYHCYLPLGASVGIWDIIRLDQDGQLKKLSVAMKKHPTSFKIKEPIARAKMEEAIQSSKPITIAKAPIAQINTIAPQNTNTMAIYALAAASLGFTKCEGQIIADRNLAAHLVELNVETQGGLKLTFTRDNPAGHGHVTGSATFGSFLNSLYHYREGIRHNCFIFC